MLKLLLLRNTSTSLPAAAFRLGFGAPFYTDAAKTVPATADGDLVYTAADSVAGNDASQATAGNRPILDLFTFNGVPAIQFRNWKSASLSGSGTPFDAQNFTLCALMTNLSNATATGAIWSYFAGSGASGRVQNNYAVPYLTESVVWNGSGAGPADIGYGACLVTLTGTASEMTLRVNGVDIATIAASAASTFGLVSLGSLIGVYCTHTAFVGLIGYGRALTGPEIDLLETWASAYASIGTTFDPAVPAFLVIGDSLSTGYGLTDLDAWPTQMFAAMTNGATYQRSFSNMAQPGSSALDWLTAAPIRLDPYYDASRPRNVCFIWLGTNDFGGETTVYNNIKSVCQGRKNVGWTVIAIDILPRGDGSGESTRVAINVDLANDFPTPVLTNIRAGATYADYLIQIGSDATIGVAGSQDNATYYQGDKTHLTAAGESVVAGYGVTVMNALGYT